MRHLLLILGLGALALSGCRDASSPAERRAAAEARAARDHANERRAEQHEAARTYYATMQLVRVCSGGASTSFVHQGRDGRLWLSPYMDPGTDPRYYHAVAPAIRISEVC
ncbi:hypothetical protein GURKE_02620 [Brevundimonas phage vB_BpoS-Gurke]|uniref:Uncharacterized protein n=1 Tax=Brevundimonas phage vB_BpoS-Gurke TaxID=2948599 RepID=A0A9E7SQK2_9CAUD|nr:hypothetical protein GURKE_02620 [Brevundimonas phage vB_BpoS-Gurke]